MTTDADTRFRLTTWPPEPLPLPRVWVYPVRLSDDGFLERDLTGPRPKRGQHGHAVEVPDELYLRELRELRLDDWQDVERFVNDYGILGSEGWSDLPAPRGAERAEAAGEAAFVLPSLRARLKGRYDRYLSKRGLSQRPLGLSHVDDFAVYARLLRDLVRIVEANQGLLTLDEVERQWEDEWVAPDVWRAGGMREAMVFVSECLSLAMHPYFYARVEIRDTDRPEHDLAAPSPGLYPVLCLQLWNHLAEQATYRVCECGCGALFVRQRGRSVYDQYRKTGVLYATVQCARRAAVRSYRQDARVVLELHDGGLSVAEIAERMEWPHDKAERKLRNALRAREARQGKAKTKGKRPKGGSQ